MNTVHMKKKITLFIGKWEQLQINMLSNTERQVLSIFLHIEHRSK
jgi:hypothetical protein